MKTYSIREIQEIGVRYIFGNAQSVQETFLFQLKPQSDEPILPMNKQEPALQEAWGNAAKKFCASWPDFNPELLTPFTIAEIIEYYNYFDNLNPNLDDQDIMNLVKREVDYNSRQPVTVRHARYNKNFGYVSLYFLDSEPIIPDHLPTLLTSLSSTRHGSLHFCQLKCETPGQWIGILPTEYDNGDPAILSPTEMTNDLENEVHESIASELATRYDVIIINNSVRIPVQIGPKIRKTYTGIDLVEILAKYAPQVKTVYCGYNPADIDRAVEHSCVPVSEKFTHEFLDAIADRAVEAFETEHMTRWQYNILKRGNISDLRKLLMDPNGVTEFQLAEMADMEDIPIEKHQLCANTLTMYELYVGRSKLSNEAVPMNWDFEPRTILRGLNPQDPIETFTLAELIERSEHYELKPVFYAKLDALKER